MFETKLQRGRFLMVVFVVVFAGLRFLNWWGAGAADDAVARRSQAIRVALQGHTPADLQPALLAGSYDANAPGLPGGPYDAVAPGDDGGIRANVEVRRRRQSRCVRVDLAADGRLSVRTEKRACR